MSEQFEKWKAEHFFAKGATDVEPLLSMGDLMSAWNAALASSYNVEMPPMNVTDDEVEQAEKFASHVTDFRSALVVERAECDCRTGQLREAYAQIAALRAQVEQNDFFLEEANRDVADLRNQVAESASKEPE